MENYNEGEDSSYIMYLDANNPYSNFRWVEPKYYGDSKSQKQKQTGRIYEVDLEYPNELHNYIITTLARQKK